MFKKKLITVTCTALFALGLTVSAAGPANAGASGCDWASGGFGASTCINTYGSGLYPGNTNVEYWSGWYSTNVCYPQAKSWGQSYWTGGYAEKWSTRGTGCFPNYGQRWVYWGTAAMKMNSRVCSHFYATFDAAQAITYKGGTPCVTIS